MPVVYLLQLPALVAGFFMRGRMGGMKSASNPIRPVGVRWVLIIYAICLTGAGLNHARDIVNGGWLPYRSVPTAVNWYWSSLTAVDLLAATLLFIQPRAGLLLTLAIIVSDVGINSYVRYSVIPEGWYGEVSLQLQTLFLGFVLGSFAFLVGSTVWPRNNPPSAH
jgi:membrane protein HdeD